MFRNWLSLTGLVVIVGSLFSFLLLLLLCDVAAVLVFAGVFVYSRHWLTSAGVTITSALASLYTGRRVRPDTAMTGEITLSGLVFPVGGIKEKVLAAHRAGIHRIILPARNEADLKDIPEDVRRELEIVPVNRINEVVEAALEKLVANPPPPLPVTDRPPEPASEQLIAKEL